MVGLGMTVVESGLVCLKKLQLISFMKMRTRSDDVYLTGEDSPRSNYTSIMVGLGTTVVEKKT